MTWAYLSMYPTYHTGEKQYIPLQLHLHTTSIQRSHRFDRKNLMVILFELCVVQKSLKLDHQFQHVIHGHNIVSSASLWNCLGSTSWSSARWNMHWKYHANSAMVSSADVMLHVVVYTSQVVFLRTGSRGMSTYGSSNSADFIDGTLALLPWWGWFILANRPKFWDRLKRHIHVSYVYTHMHTSSYIYADIIHTYLPIYLCKCIYDILHIYIYVICLK